MPQSHFLERIREDILREIAWVVTNKLRDPRVPSIITYAEIDLAADTRNATIYVSIFGDEKEKKSAIIALNHAAPFIQKSVSQRVSLRNFPKFYFKEDKSVAHGLRINELLSEIHDDLEQPAQRSEE